MRALGLPARFRIKRSRAFAAIFARRCSAADENLVVFVHRNSVGYPRLGLSVSRKHGGAVRRNRLKRLLREAFRLTRASLPASFDLVCVPRVRPDVSLNHYLESLPRLARRAAARWSTHDAF